MVAGNVARLEMNLRGAQIIARDEAVEYFGEEAPLLRPEPSHDAEIDRDQLAVLVDEQIAGMHVGMEEAIAQRMPQKRLDHGARQRHEIVALGLEPRVIVQRDAVDPFEREDVAGITI